MKIPCGRFQVLKALFLVLPCSVLCACIYYRLEPSTSVVYHHEQTIAVVTQEPSNNITYCRLIEVLTTQDAVATLEKLQEAFQVIPLTFPQMMNLLDACLYFALSSSAYNETNEQVDSWSWMQGILPGTKWCGTGHIAKHYDDLGALMDVDICCRGHDHCPVKIKSWVYKYELFNFSLHTKSACQCDEQFFSCLKNTNSTVAQVVGRTFFNIFKTSCVQLPEEGMEEPGFHNNLTATFRNGYLQF